MKTRLSVGVLLGLSLLGVLPAPAEAQVTVPPVGQWTAIAPDGSGTITLVLRGDGVAGYFVNGVGAAGVWAWCPTSPVSGIVTVRYLSPGVPSLVRFRVTYVDGFTILVSGPGFVVVFRRAC
jgi:hypothetical protein